jgi:AcrR family transcriptional regulator
MIGEPMKDTKQRIVTEGLDLLVRGGFGGVTLGVLAQQTGLSKSGLFAHFGSKSEVQLRLLEEAAEVSRTTILEPALKIASGLPRLRAVFEGWLGWTEKAGLRGGCPVAGGFFELDDADPQDPVRRRLVALEAEWRGFLAELTAAAVKTGDLSPDLDVDQFVWELCGIYLNHHVFVSIHSRPQGNQTRADRLRRTGESLEPAVKGDEEDRGETQPPLRSVSAVAFPLGPRRDHPRLEPDVHRCDRRQRGAACAPGGPARDDQ